MTTSKTLRAVLFAGALSGIVWLTAPSRADERTSSSSGAGLTQATLNQTLLDLQKRIKPQPGESRWLEIPWFLDVHEARQKAAAEGKPLFIYSGGGATGIGPC
jgi:hypothetical protein